jgi:hypothetical protein
MQCLILPLDLKHWLRLQLQLLNHHLNLRLRLHLDLLLLTLRLNLRLKLKCLPEQLQNLILILKLCKLGFAYLMRMHHLSLHCQFQVEFECSCKVPSTNHCKHSQLYVKLVLKP